MLNLLLAALIGQPSPPLTWPLEPQGYQVTYEYGVHSSPDPDEQGWECLIKEVKKEARCFEIRSLKGASYCPVDRDLDPYEHPAFFVEWTPGRTQGFLWRYDDISQGDLPNFFNTPSVWFMFDYWTFIPMDPDCIPVHGPGCARKASLYFDFDDNYIFTSFFEYRWNPTWPPNRLPTAVGHPMELPHPCRGFWVIFNPETTRKEY